LEKNRVSEKDKNNKNKNISDLYKGKNASKYRYQPRPCLIKNKNHGKTYMTKTTNSMSTNWKR
jgi:hypothetical protein